MRPSSKVFLRVLLALALIILQAATAATALAYPRLTLGYGEYPGVVQTQPHVHLVFWGKPWTEAGAPTEAREELNKLFEGLSGSAYQGILTQYFDVDGHSVSKSVAFNPTADDYVDTSEHLSRSEITFSRLTEEANYAASQAGWTSGSQDQIIVIPGPGSTYSGSAYENCGYHTPLHSWLAYPSGQTARCLRAAIGIPGTLSVTASHEYAEAVTDTEGYSGWRASEGEIADICGGSTPLVQLPSGAWASQLWDNHLGKCAGSDPTPPQIKVETTGAQATNLLHQVELKGVINPGGYQTSYHFDWGTSQSYGNEAPVPSKSIEAGTSNVAVSQLITGLNSGVTYHYRLVEETSAGTAYSSDATFTPNWAPRAETRPADAKSGSAHQAVLVGSVNPRGLSTTYQFEYGATKGYGTSVPVPAQSAGAGSEDLIVSQTIKGLNIGQMYHFRLVATNSDGTTYGTDQMFSPHAVYQPRFEAEVYEASLSMPVSESLVFTSKTGKVKCSGGSLFGTLSPASSALSLEAAYTGCKAFGLGGKIAVNSCHFSLNVLNSGPPYAGSEDVVCAKEGDAIVVTATGSNCTLRIPAQSGVKGIEYSNTGLGAERAVTVSYNLTALSYKEEGSECASPGSHADGSYVGMATLRALYGEGKIDGVYVSGEELSQLGSYVGGMESSEPAAQPRFEDEKYPASVRLPLSESFVFTSKTGKVKCSGGQLYGEAAGEVTSMPLLAEYSGCKVFGLGGKIAVNSCHFNLNVLNAGPPYAGSEDVVCAEEGDAIVVTATGSNCTLRIPAQSGVKGIEYSNTGLGAERAVTVSYNLTALSYKEEGSECVSPGSHADGSYAGSSTLSAVH